MISTHVAFKKLTKHGMSEGLRVSSCCGVLGLVALTVADVVGVLFVGTMVRALPPRAPVFEPLLRWWLL